MYSLNMRIASSMSLAISLEARIHCEFKGDLLGLYEDVYTEISSTLSSSSSLIYELSKFSFSSFRTQDSRVSLHSTDYLNLSRFFERFTEERVHRTLVGLNTFSIRRFVLEFMISHPSIRSTTIVCNESVEFVSSVYIVFFNTLYSERTYLIEEIQRFLNDFSVSPRLI